MYSILVKYKDDIKYYFNDQYSRCKKAMINRLEHLMTDDFYKKNNYNFELVKITEKDIEENDLECLEDILETYLLNDGTIYFNINGGFIAELIPNSYKIIKNNVLFNTIESKIDRRITWNGWNIYDYIK